MLSAVASQTRKSSWHGDLSYIRRSPVTLGTRSNFAGLSAGRLLLGLGVATRPSPHGCRVFDRPLKRAR